MYIDEIPFKITISESIHFGIAELIKNEKASAMATSIKQVVQRVKDVGAKYNI